MKMCVSTGHILITTITVEVFILVKIHFIIIIINIFSFSDIEASFFVNPEARSAQIGSNIQLQCLSPRSEPIAQVDWEKNNIKLSGYENGSVTLLSEKRLSSTILLKNLSNSDAGTYQCVAYNKLLPGKAVRSLGASVTIAGTVHISSNIQELAHFISRYKVGIRPLPFKKEA